MIRDAFKYFKIHLQLCFFPHQKLFGRQAAVSHPAMNVDAGIFFILFILVTGIEGNILTVPVHHKYHYVRMIKTWSEAQSYCRSHYVDLATVDTMEEHQAMLEMFPNDQGSIVWVGLRRSILKSWGWSDGTRAEDWVSGRILEPSSSGGDCVWMDPEGDWKTGDCDGLKASLCYKIENGVESYFLNPSTLTWRGAQSFCRGSYTDLVTVKTPDQIQGLVGTSEGSSVWIGLFRDEWAWSDQTPRAFRAWDQQNPDNYGGSEDCGCLEMQHRQWNTLPCETKLHFLCYTSSWQTMLNIVLASKVPISDVQNSLQQQLQILFKDHNVRLTLRSAAKQRKPTATKTDC